MSAQNPQILEELGIASPWLNVPGFLGYLPPVHLELPVQLGAFLPPPLSLISRNPAGTRMSIPFPGGVLMRTGLPNPGLSAALHQYNQRWSRLAIPLWLSFLPRNAAEAQEMSEQVDELEYAATFQVLLPRGMSTQEKTVLLAAVQGEKPFFVELPLDEICRETVGMIQKSGASGIIVSAPRGSLPVGDQWISGRLYGPTLYAQASLAVETLVRGNLTVIAGCGIGSMDQGTALLKLGAMAVQMDMALWA